MTYPELVAAAEALRTKSGLDIAVTTAWPTWIQFEGIRGDPQHSLRHRGRRLQRPGRAAQGQLAGIRQQLQRFLDMQKAGQLQVRRPGQRRRPALLLRQGGDQLQLVRQPQRHRQERPSSAGPTASCPMTRRSSPSRSTPSSAAPACGR
ncbi:MAG: hypothetical protein WDN49_20720 [Acetobacteraceae bacterium]